MSDMKLPPALARFLRTSERLKELLGEYGAANKARGMPEMAVRVYDQHIKVQITSSYDSDVAKQAHQAGTEVLARCKAEAFAEAERKRDGRLTEIAWELVQIRDALPSITTQLVIELGVTSRQLAHEAETGEQ